MINKVVEELKLQRCIFEVYFAYNTILGVYPQLTADINELGEIPM